MSNYHAKYLKYKHKYLELKQLEGGTNTSTEKTLNVNIIVDVQNCFMMGGSFNTENKYDSDKQKDIDLNVKQINEILSLIDTKTKMENSDTYNVFTRDNHPLGHMSIASFGTEPNPPATWQSHCVDRSVRCYRLYDKEKKAAYMVKRESNNKDTVGRYLNKIKLPAGENSELYSYYESLKNIPNTPIPATPIKGSALSVMYLLGKSVYKTHIEQIYNLIKNSDVSLADIRFNDDSGGNGAFEENSDNYLQLNGGATNSYDIMKNSPNLANRVSSSMETLEDPNKVLILNQLDQIIKPPSKYIQLLKGERCDQDSNSAFNYHLWYDGKNPPVNMKANENNSTGLFEYIIDLKRQHNPINLNICGNVGNVCVIHTFLQGIIMRNKVYRSSFKNKVNFNYYLAGTRFAPKEVLGNTLGGFSAMPDANEQFLIMMKIYIELLINGGDTPGDQINNKLPTRPNTDTNTIKDYYNGRPFAQIAPRVHNKDKQDLHGTINFFGYDLTKFGSITITYKDGTHTITHCLCSGATCNC